MIVSYRNSSSQSIMLRWRIGQDFDRRYTEQFMPFLTDSRCMELVESKVGELLMVQDQRYKPVAEDPIYRRMFTVCILAHQILKARNDYQDMVLERINAYRQRQKKNIYDEKAFGRNGTDRISAFMQAFHPLLFIKREAKYSGFKVAGGPFLIEFHASLGSVNGNGAIDIGRLSTMYEEALNIMKVTKEEYEHMHSISVEREEQRRRNAQEQDWQLRGISGLERLADRLTGYANELNQVIQRFKTLEQRVKEDTEPLQESNRMIEENLAELRRMQGRMGAE